MKTVLGRCKSTIIKAGMLGGYQKIRIMVSHIPQVNAYILRSNTDM